MALKSVLLTVLLTISLGATYLWYSDVVRSLRRLTPTKYNADNCDIQTATPDYEWSYQVFAADNPDLVTFDGDFMINDTEALYDLKDALACMPTNFGYDTERGEQVFPPYHYPTCRSELISEPPLVSLDPVTFNLTIECPDLQSIKYITDEDVPTDRVWLLDDIKDIWEIKNYTEPVTLKNTTEYVYAGCGDSEKFTAATYQPRFNEEAYTRSAAKAAELGQTQKPLTILMLTVDSVSRKHFFRKLKNTVRLLNRLKSEDDYSVFDFKLHNVYGPATIENIIPIFANFTMTNSEDKMQDIIGKPAMWNILKELGYITYLGLEECDLYFQKQIGNLPEVDHITSSFYCAAWKFLGLSMQKRGDLHHRCIGNHMSHYYILNYTQSFIDLYPDLNQWAYVHINTAHEDTGQHAVTLDVDLTVFLEMMLIDSSRDFLVVLQADHGMRFKNWYSDIEGYQEHKLPALFVIASNSLLDRVPGSRDALNFNSQRLTSKIDLRATVLSLSTTPYDLTYSIHDDPYLDRHYDLSSELVPSNRTCHAIGILPWMCACPPLVELSHSEYSKGTDMHILVSNVVDAALSRIHRKTSISVSSTRELSCKRLSLDNVAKVYAAGYDNILEHIQVQFKVKESKHVLLEVFAVVGSDFRDFMIKPRSDRDFPVPTAHRGYEAYIEVIGVIRKDPYHGPCEKFSRLHGLDGQFCICTDLAEEQAEED